MIDVETVRKLPRFSGLSPDAHAWLAVRMSRKGYGKGEMLFLEGGDCTSLYLVERGVVKVFRSLESGRELIVGLFRHGDAVGEVALIDGAGYPASAMAHEATTVLVMRREDYLYYLQHLEGAAQALVRDLIMRMRVMQQRIEDLGGGAVEYRIGRVLQALCGPTRDDDGHVHAAVPLTRQDLADMVGARVETVIRIMSRWQKDGLVGNDAHGLWVRDRDTLAALARSE